MYAVRWEFMRHASIVLTEQVERGVMSMFCGQRNQYIYGER